MPGVEVGPAVLYRFRGAFRTAPKRRPRGRFLIHRERAKHLVRSVLEQTFEQTRRPPHAVADGLRRVREEHVPDRRQFRQLRLRVLHSLRGHRRGDVVVEAVSGGARVQVRPRRAERRDENFRVPIPRPLPAVREHVRKVTEHARRRLPVRGVARPVRPRRRDVRDRHMATQTAPIGTRVDHCDASPHGEVVERPARGQVVQRGHEDVGVARDVVLAPPPADVAGALLAFLQRRHVAHAVAPNLSRDVAGPGDDDAQRVRGVHGLRADQLADGRRRLRSVCRPVGAAAAAVGGAAGRVSRAMPRGRSARARRPARRRRVVRAVPDGGTARG